MRFELQAEKLLRGQRRFLVLETRNDGVRFTNSNLRPLSQQFQTLRERYDSAQAAIVEEVLTIAAGYSEPLTSLGSLLARLDVLLRFAVVWGFSLSTSLPLSFAALPMCRPVHLQPMCVHL